MKKTLKTACVLLLCLLLSGCGQTGKTIEQYRDAGIEALNAGDPSKAAEEFSHALDYYGTSKPGFMETDIRRYLAEALMRSGDYAAADARYQELLADDGRKNEYLDLCAVCIVKAGGDLSEALSLYEEADGNGASGDAHIRAMFTIGEAMSASGNEELKEKAKELYDKAAAERGMTAELAVRLGNMSFQSGDYEDACARFGEGLALADAALGEASLTEERAAEIAETRRALLYNRAVCYEYLGDYAAALTEMEAVAAEYGTTEEMDHEITFLRTRVDGGN